MTPRPPAMPDTPDLRRPQWPDDEPAPQDLPTLREILSRFRQQGTAPGRLAAGARAAEPERRAAPPKLASLRSLFLDSTGEPTLGPAHGDEAWLRPPPPRR